MSETPCLNCGAATTGRFCAECGQFVDVQVPTLPALLHESFASFVSYDARLWRTLRTLVFEPG